MAERNRRGALGVALPPILWAAHFIAVYGFLSAACGARGLLGLDSGRVLTALAALLTLALIALTRRWSDAGTRGGMLETGALWSAVISAIAVVVQSIPAAMFGSCGIG